MFDLLADAAAGAVVAAADLPGGFWGWLIGQVGVAGAGLWWCTRRIERADTELTRVRDLHLTEMARVRDDHAKELVRISGEHAKELVRVTDEHLRSIGVVSDARITDWRGIVDRMEQIVERNHAVIDGFARAISQQRSKPNGHAEDTQHRPGA